MGKRKVLHIYYDNPNKASDTYLKYLREDCAKNNIDTRVFNNVQDWLGDESNYELYLEPTKATIPKYWKETQFNVDYPSATAKGIYNFITKEYPNRETIIAVIGRGLVGKQLINMLIDYGYTVCEFNSKSNFDIMKTHCCVFADIVVGLATEQIFNSRECAELRSLNVLLIDSGNNFETKDKKTCGKWTREVIINRIKEDDSYGYDF